MFTIGQLIFKRVKFLQHVTHVIMKYLKQINIIQGPAILSDLV